MRWHLMREIEERGAEAVVDDAIAEALDGPDAIYLSVDIDVIDPGLAPGTGTPEPGGMLTARAPAGDPPDRRRRSSSRGMDIVEVSPPYDHAEIDRDGRQPRRARGDLARSRPRSAPARPVRFTRSPRRRRARVSADAAPTERARPALRPRPARGPGRPRPVPRAGRPDRRSDPGARRRDRAGSPCRSPRSGCRRHRRRHRSGDARAGPRRSRRRPDPAVAGRLAPRRGRRADDAPARRRHVPPGGRSRSTRCS